MPASAEKKGLLLVVSSPSGAGKTTLCRQLVDHHPQLQFSVSYTTRLPRGLEISGLDYHFITDESFDQMIKEDCFAEWAYVHGRRYGTAKSTVRTALEQGRHVLFDIDYQGAENLLRQFPKEARLVYILPPSLEILAQRLYARGTDSVVGIEQRLAKAKEELLHYSSYHYLVINEDFNEAYQELALIYKYEKATLDNATAHAMGKNIVALYGCKTRAGYAEKLLALS